MIFELLLELRSRSDLADDDDDGMLGDTDLRWDWARRGNVRIYIWILVRYDK